MVTNNAIDTGPLATSSEALVATNTRNLIAPSTLNSVMSPLLFSGFQSWAAGAPYWSVAGTDFTLLVGGTGFIQSKQITWVGGQTLAALSAGATHYVYIDNTGTIQSTTTRTDALYQNQIILFEVLVDSSIVSVVIVSKENHPYSFQPSASSYLHDTAGTVIENVTNGANITLNGTQSIQINGADVLNDHGLETTIPDSGGAAITFRFMYTNAAGKWVQNTTTTIFPSSWNNAGTITALTAGRFATFRLFAAKDSLNTSTPLYFVVYDTAQYTNQAAANTAIANGTTATSTNELQALELCQLGFVTVRQSTGLITNVVINKATLRSTVSGAASTSANLITTDTSAFTGWLSAADTTVQASLNTLDQVLIGGTSGYPAVSNGAATKPTYQQLSLTAGVTGVLPIVNGGTNANAMATTDGVVYHDGTRLVTTAVGTAGQVLKSNGAAVAPTFQEGIRFAKVTLTSQQIKTIHATPITLVSAPSANKIIYVLSTNAHFHYGGTSVFTAGAGQTINIFFTNLAGQQLNIPCSNSFILSNAEAFSYITGMPSQGTKAAGSLDSQPLILANPSATEISGNAANDNTITINISYVIADLVP